MPQVQQAHLVQKGAVQEIRLSKSIACGPTAAGDLSFFALTFSFCCDTIKAEH
jgi:hypothetical protein